MRFNIVHNYIFIIIDDINNYIHKRVNPLSPVRIPTATPIRLARFDMRIHVTLCNKKTSTLQTCVGRDETAGIKSRSMSNIVRCHEEWRLSACVPAPLLRVVYVRYADRNIRTPVIYICHVVSSSIILSNTRTLHFEQNKNELFWDYYKRTRRISMLLAVQIKRSPGCTPFNILTLCLNHFGLIFSFVLVF